MKKIGTPSASKKTLTQKTSVCPFSNTGNNKSSKINVSGSSIISQNGSQTNCNTISSNNNHVSGSSGKNMYFIKQPEVKIQSLEFHTGTVTEINKYKMRGTHYLTTCSYDRYCVLWDMTKFQVHKKFYFGSWAMSCTLFFDRYQSLKDVMYICGGFKPGEPIKVFDVETEEEMPSKQIKIASNLSPLILCYMHDEPQGATNIIVGTDAGILFYNTKTCSLEVYYKTKHLITGIKVSTSSRIRHIYFLEYGGIFRIMDPSSKKVMKETKIGYTALDLQFWDDNTYVICGDCQDCGFKLLYDGKNNLINNFPNSHNKVVIGVSTVDSHPFGKCLVTLGADNKIKLFTQNRFA